MIYTVNTFESSQNHKKLQFQLRLSLAENNIEIAIALTIINKMQSYSLLYKDRVQGSHGGTGPTVSGTQDTPMFYFFMLMS